MNLNLNLILYCDGYVIKNTKFKQFNFHFLIIS